MGANMNVLSLCDGMSCCQISLVELGCNIDGYYASEIYDKAIQVTNENFPNTIQMGDVLDVAENKERLKTLPKIDLIAFGFPCRSLSNATAGREEYNNGLKGISGLFYACNDILQWIKINNNPGVEFIVENVDSNESKKDDINEINKLLGVEPILIDSNRFSAQDRKRLYWTNIPVEYPTNIVNNAVIKDILDDCVEEKHYYDDSKVIMIDRDKKVCAALDVKCHDIGKRIYNINYKCATLTACRGGYRQKKIYINNKCRKLTPNEYRRLQTIPDWVKMNVADSHIYNMCGDGWTIEVIKYILSFSNCVREAMTIKC